MRQKKTPAFIKDGDTMYAVNRKARRMTKAMGLKAEPLKSTPIRKTGEDEDGNAIYHIGDYEFKPPYRRAS